MNDPFIPNFASANRVESETARELIEPMDAHLCVSRTLELLAADMNAHPELIQPIDTRLPTQRASEIDQLLPHQWVPA
jgi:hypothetical protein